MAVDGIQDGSYLHAMGSQSLNGESTLSSAAPWKALQRIELDSEYVSEKLLNLEVLLMETESKVNDHEGLVLRNDDISTEYLEMALEFDMLYWILNCEVQELEAFMAFIEREIVEAQKNLATHGYFEESLMEQHKGKLRETNERLSQSRSQVTDIETRAVKFRRMLCSGINAEKGSENCVSTSVNSKWKLQNVEHQRSLLQLYEKSLAKELDLEKKLSDSRDAEDALKAKLGCLEHEAYCLKVSTENILQRTFSAENSSDILLGMSKELLDRLQNQLNLEELKVAYAYLSSEASKLRENIQSLETQLRGSEFELELAKSSTKASQEQQELLQAELLGMKHLVENLREELHETENKVEESEAKCAPLAKTNTDLNEKLRFLKGSGSVLVSLLEKKLNNSDTQLELAKTSVGAIKEQQDMLYSMFDDMENLIEDLKGNVSKAESRAETAESKCSLLTETNLELNEELNFLRCKLECIGVSLRDLEDAKIVTAKDIARKAKIFSGIVLKLAMERERLQLQISSLGKSNKFPEKKCTDVKEKTPIRMTGYVSFAEKVDASEEPVDEFSTSNQKVESTFEELTHEINVDKKVAVEDSPYKFSRMATLSIDPTQINSKCIVVVVLIMMLSVIAVSFAPPEIWIH